MGAIFSDAVLPPSPEAPRQHEPTNPLTPCRATSLAPASPPRAGGAVAPSSELGPKHWAGPVPPGHRGVLSSVLPIPLFIKPSKAKPELKRFVH